MGFQPDFDPEIGDESVRACLNDGALQGAESYALAVNTTTGTSVEVPPGVYRVYLAGQSATESIALITDAAAATPAFPSGSPSASVVFPGNEVVRVRVQPDKRFVSAISAVGSGTLYLVPVVKL